MGRGKAWWGGLCAVGALVTAELKLYPGQPLTEEGYVLHTQAYADAVKALGEVINEKVYPHVRTIPGWNDDLPLFRGKGIVIKAMEQDKSAILLG